MKVRLETLAIGTLVIAEGRLDFGAAAGFQQQVEQVLAAVTTAPSVVIIDCALLNYVSSAGLRVFLLAARAAQRAGVGFSLCALTPAVREVFDVSGFSRIIELHPDRDAALGRAGSRGLAERRTSAPAIAAELPALMQFVDDFWSAAALPAAAALSFELALEEIFINVVTHGSPPGTQPRVEVSLRLEAGSVTMTLEDDGPEFDPLSLPAPDIEADLDARPIGNLGVYLLRRLMDSVSYERRDARNRLTLTKQIAA